MKLQFFSLTPSVPGVNMLRLKDGVYSRVPLLPGASVEVRRKVLAKMQERRFRRCGREHWIRNCIRC